MRFIVNGTEYTIEPSGDRFVWKTGSVISAETFPSELAAQKAVLNNWQLLIEQENEEAEIGNANYFREQANRFNRRDYL